MARRLILDTGVLVASERGALSLGDVIAGEDDLVIAAITVAELMTGVDLATDAHRRGRATFLEQILRTLPVEVYDLRTAQTHGRLLAHVHRTGTRRGAHDLLIAATAVATGRTLVTTDRSARFADLPDVECVVVG